MEEYQKYNLLSLVNELKENGKYYEAEDLLNQYLSFFSDDVEVLAVIGHIYILQNKLAAAEQVLLRANSLCPNFSAVYINQARLQLRKSNFILSLDYARVGLQLSSNDSECKLVLAACLCANQIYDESLNLVEQVIIKNPNYADAYACRAMIHFKKNANINCAINDAKIALSIKPHLDQLWGFLGSLKYQKKDLLNAILAMENAYKIDSNNINYATCLADYYNQNKQLDKSIEILSKTSIIHFENHNLLFKLGVMLQEANKFNEAKLAYNKALKINPNNADIYNNLGVISMKIQDWNEAYINFATSLSINPISPQTINNLGSVLISKGKYNEAIIQYESAIAIKPNYVEAYVNLGVALQNLHKLIEAANIFRKAIALKFDHAEAHYNLGNVFIELNQVDLALESYYNSLSLNSNYDDAISAIGRILLNQGKHQEGIMMLQKSIGYINFNISHGLKIN